MCSLRLSSSSDLRIVSFAQPSQETPMTGFRHAQNLHAYSGGTVRESHPVLYSLVALSPHPQALKRNIHLREKYTRTRGKSQSQKERNRLLCFMRFRIKKKNLENLKKTLDKREIVRYNELRYGRLAQLARASA